MKPFNFQEVDQFDKHILSSIPTFADLNYLAMRMINDFSQENTYVIDVGCSTGRFLRALPKRDGVRYLGVERFMKPDPQKGIEFFHGDIFDPKSYTDRGREKSASVVVSMFTMQFMPYRKRQQFISLVDTLLVDGGIFICAEKVHMNDPCIESIVQANLLEWKKQHFSEKEILDKTISLKSVMLCQTEKGLCEELSRIGVTENIWQWGQFVCKVSRKNTLKGKL